MRTNLPNLLRRFSILSTVMVSTMLRECRLGAVENIVYVWVFDCPCFLGVVACFMFPAQMWNVMGHLVRVKAPRVLLQLVTLIYMTNGFMKQDLDLVEYFAGGMAVAWSRKMLSNLFCCLLSVCQTVLETSTTST